MTDRTMKLLLAAIALGLWMNVLGDWIRPVPVEAQLGTDTTRYLRNIQSSVNSIESDLNGIYRGRCRNNKIC